MIHADTKHFTFTQLADLRDVVNGRCGEPNSTAVVKALKSNLGKQYRPSKAVVAADGQTFINPDGTEDDLFMLVDEMSAYMAQADITEPVVITYDLRAENTGRLQAAQGHIIVSGMEDARFSGDMLDKAVRAMKANNEIGNARVMLSRYEYVDDEERGALYIHGTNAVYTLTLGTEGAWILRMYNNAWDALDIRKVVAIREFPTLVDALTYLGEV